MGATGASVPLLCLACLARTDEPFTVAAQVFQLVEGACSACGRYGPAAEQLRTPVPGPDGQRSLFRVG